MMMNLLPGTSTSSAAKDTGGTNGERQALSGRQTQCASLPADCVECVSGFMNGIVIKLHLNPGASFEDTAIHHLYLCPTAFDAAEWVVHRALFRWQPVLSHDFQITLIKGVIELGERLNGR